MIGYASRRLMPKMWWDRQPRRASPFERKKIEQANDIMVFFSLRMCHKGFIATTAKNKRLWMGLLPCPFVGPKPELCYR